MTNMVIRYSSVLKSYKPLHSLNTIILVPMQIIEECWERPCKFSTNGCLQVGDRATLKEHMDSCSFRNVECPYWKCALRVSLENVEDHVILAHCSVGWKPWEEIQ